MYKPSTGNSVIQPANNSNFAVINITSKVVTQKWQHLHIGWFPDSLEFFSFASTSSRLTEELLHILEYSCIRFIQDDITVRHLARDGNKHITQCLTLHKSVNEYATTNMKVHL